MIRLECKGEASQSVFWQNLGEMGHYVTKPFVHLERASVDFVFSHEPYRFLLA